MVVRRVDRAGRRGVAQDQVSLDAPSYSSRESDRSRLSGGGVFSVWEYDEMAIKRRMVPRGLG
jgi:hypothetical protein